MIGSMATIRLPGGPWPGRGDAADGDDRGRIAGPALRGAADAVAVPMARGSGDLPPTTEFDIVVRISAQVYNYLGQFERLSSILAGFAGVNRPQSAPDPSAA